ncbi:hypothetical protein B296_00001228 [Ensete ventricosum]|uniref:Uncharacterized protein n=1 Tax=Ensete ventricosum TaxID=4639 RepID=A0A427AAZ2_ENSVE|nr:hypothetical protein B296_00001228 [Ensete ventricosum]
MCAPSINEDDDRLLLKKPFDLQFLQLADIYRKMAAKRSESEVAAMVEEEEGSSNVDCGYGVTSWLQVALVTTRVRLQ